MSSASAAVPNRGAYRIEPFRFDVPSLKDCLDRFDDEDWGTLDNGAHWRQVQLKYGKRGEQVEHPRLAQCPELLEVANAFGAPIVNLTLASLAPGGWIKEHRDLSGGIPMGIARVHVPICTDPQLEFYVDRKRVRMAPGEAWLIDTTYLHRLEHRGERERIHYIIDLKLNATMRGHLHPFDLRYGLHMLHFGAICARRGLSLARRDPRGLARRAESFLRLRVLGQSVLNFDDE